MHLTSPSRARVRSRRRRTAARRRPSAPRRSREPSAAGTRRPRGRRVARSSRRRPRATGGAYTTRRARLLHGSSLLTFSSTYLRKDQRQPSRVDRPFTPGVTGRDPVESGYERRIRLASEFATWGIAGILVGSAALPTTDPISRVGLLGSAGLLALFALLWFHVIPAHIFGRQRFTIGT